MNLWIDVAMMTTLMAVGNILFGHFEQETPKWRRLLKLVMLTSLTALVAWKGGHVRAMTFVGGVAALGLTVHVVYLRHHGIDPWTAEPRDKYYALRGWKA